MKISKSYLYNAMALFLIVALSSSSLINAQVGIGTTSPDPTSILDISSTTQGMLAPRMTTTQRSAISTPANGLLVFDTDLKAFYYYDTTTTSWIKINSSAEKRDNYKLIKSASDLSAELTAGGGSKYLLTSNTLYEINGTITISFPIELNNAYITGRDTNEDKLVRAGGVLFTGTTGGSIRGVSLTASGAGGTVFSISGSSAQNLIFRDSFVIGSNSVGSISGMGLVFISIVQYVGNTSGITFTNINRLLLSNEGWDSSNAGTFETFTGSFDLIQKVGGFSNVTAGKTGMRVTGITGITGDAILKEVVFYGGGTYIAGTSPYTGYNFTKSWVVNSPGIPVEMDDVASGNIYMTTPATTTFTASGAAGRKKISGTTSSTEMFRTSSAVSNRIVYEGSKTRKFNIQASFTVDAVNNNKFFTFFIAKNGVVLAPTSISTKVIGGGDERALSFTGTTTLAPNDFIEVWAQNDTDTSGLIVPFLNLLIY
ncbi:hypothetical protein [Constantimarinum furrinae]|uniref:Cell wall anchor protein n=1 Tax=Constantimarinum furrinae TaxID=2562285 RepID=A0A7G8PTV9_9FLAO|nr:hypothetical protein [Constantimarinum furrinae]QNJ97775.1 hypothetical protein ALE3EI_1209 [Constantimarinum furrinae]